MVLQTLTNCSIWNGRHTALKSNHYAVQLLLNSAVSPNDIYLPSVFCSRAFLLRQHDPDWDKAVTEDERKKELIR